MIRVNLSKGISEKSISQNQQQLMGMAWAVRQGEMKRKDATKAVLDIADGDMTDKELEKFAKTKHKDLPNIKENFEQSASLENIVGNSPRLYRSLSANIDKEFRSLDGLILFLKSLNTGISGEYHLLVKQVDLELFGEMQGGLDYYPIYKLTVEQGGMILLEIFELGTEVDRNEVLWIAFARTVKFSSSDMDEIISVIKNEG